MRFRLLIMQAAFVTIAAVGFFLLPRGFPRAVLTAPVLLWVPGRSVVAALRVARSAGKWTVPLSMVLSVITLIIAGLVANLLTGSVPLGVLPIAVSVVLLPLTLLETGWGVEPAALLRFGALGAVGILAGGWIVLTVATSLPGEPKQPYLEFALAGQYATVTGNVTVTPGQILHVPVSVRVSGRGVDGLTVAAELNGRPIPAVPAVPVRSTGPESGTAELTVPAPDACLSQLDFVLRRGGTELRGVNLYLRRNGGTACVRG